MGLVAAILLVWGAASLIGALTRPKPVVEPASPPGSFRPTAAQWSNLSLASVDLRDFAAALDTDGKIAVNEDHATQVFSPLSGRVTRVLAKAGDGVRAGQPLFAVRATEFVQGQSDLVAAQAQLKLAETAAARQQALLKIQGAALKDVQQSEADLANARSALDAVRNRLRILGEDEAGIAALETSGGGKPMIGETVVRAPISGVVTQRAVGAGQNIASVVNNGAAAPAFTVSDLRRVWLVANVREEDAGAVHLGDPITARVTAFPGRAFNGRVNFIAPTVDPNSRRIVVRSELDNPDGALRPEMFAELAVSTAPPSRSLSAPEAAVIYEGQETRVWVAAPDHTLQLRKITVGRTQNGRVEVVSGLRAGEQVVEAGAIFIDRASTSD